MRILGLFSRALFVLVVLATFNVLPAKASRWYKPTQKQLKMTKDPKAPNAAAVYLYRQEKVNDKERFHSFYAVIKVLTAAGKKWADVKLPEYDSTVFHIGGISGRTIEPDGKVIPFKGKPYKKLIVKGNYDGNQVKVMQKVFTLPDVEVGSILEYRYDLDYDTNLISSPHWIIQQPLFVHEAHYHFVPSDDYWQYTTTDAQGHQIPVNHLLYTGVLPKGNKVVAEAARSIAGVTTSNYDLVVKNVPALVHEKDEVPMDSVSYRLLFTYSPFVGMKDYWDFEGKKWSQSVNKFAKRTKVIRAAVAKIVKPGDSDAVKAQKLYEAVMKLDNTDYTRVHSKAENKAEGVKLNNATDIWEAKRGTSDQLTMLYIALARAAGLKVYAMRVTDRDRDIFVKQFLNWNQLQDDIAIVVLNGKEVYVDPGDRYEDFGKLAWFHTLVGGIRQTAKGTVLADTPGGSYKWNEESRIGTLTLGPDGSISGQVRVVDTGDFSRRIREKALEEGIDKLKKDEQKRWNNLTPPGVQVKLDHFLGLTSTDTALMEILDVSGTLGTRAGHMRIVPGNIMEAGAKPLFTAPTRKLAIDLGPAYMVQDNVTVQLPSNYTVQGVPKNASLKFMPNAAYGSAYKVSGHTYNYQREAIVDTVEFLPTSYPKLKSYFEQVSQADRQPLVFKVGPVPAKAAAGGQ
jgi:hypothetical protein